MIYTDDEIRAELDREIVMRVRVYTKRSGGTLTPTDLRAINLMKAAANRFGADYALDGDDAPQGPPPDEVWVEFPGSNTQAVRLLATADPQLCKVEARFSGNSFYQYDDVPREVVGVMFTLPPGESGKWFRRHIIDGGYAYRKVANPAARVDIADLDEREAEDADDEEELS